MGTFERLHRYWAATDHITIAAARDRYPTHHLAWVEERFPLIWQEWLTALRRWERLVDLPDAPAR